MNVDPYQLRLQHVRSAANALMAAALTTGILSLGAAVGPIYVARPGFVPGVLAGGYLLAFGACFLLRQVPARMAAGLSAALWLVAIALPLLSFAALLWLPPAELDPAVYMSPNAAILALFCSVSLAALTADETAWFGQGLAIAAAAILFVFVAGMAFGEPRLYELSPRIHLSPISALGFALCIAALLMHRPGAGAVGLFTSRSVSGSMLRRQTVPIVLIPLVVAWAINASGIAYSGGVELSLALVAIGTIFPLLALMSAHAVAIEKLEASRTRLKDTLVGTERDFRLLVERIANYAVYMIDPTGRIGSWNAGAERLHGFAAADIRGRDYAELFTPEDRAADVPQRLMASARESGQATHNGWRLRKDGTRFLTSCSLTAVRDEDGTLRGFSKITHDVTEQKLAQAEREELLLRMQTVIDTASEAIIVTDAHGVIESFNPAAENMFGYSILETQGRKLSLLAPEHAPANGTHECPLDELAAGERQERKARHKSGRIFPVELTVSQMRIQGQPKFTIMARDITERKQAEDALRESEERLQLALEGAELGVWDIDLASGRFTCSPLVWRMLGYAPEEIGGPYTLGFGLMHPDDEANVAKAFDDFVSGRVPQFEEEFRLRTKPSEWLWVLARARVVRRDASGAPQLVSGVQLDISDRKRAEETARIVSLHDPLTGLPNRALIYEFGEHMLSAARRAHHKLAVLFIDLDRFKQVNDVYGHQTGDELLREVARRIMTSVRGEDLVGRLAGDEFVAILSPIRAEQDVTHAADKILQAVGAPYRLGDVELSMSPSIGIALYPEDAGDVDALINHADAAMYIAKQRGRNNYQFYTTEISQRARKALVVERQLRDGVDHAEFRLFYQPIVSAVGNRVSGTEALLRWQHEGLEVPAQQFLTTAEAAGIMSTLGDWCIGEACRQQAAWQGKGLPGLRVAINISPTQFRQYNFVERVRRTLTETGANPACIELEITEAAFNGDIGEAAETLQRLKDMGLSICLDEFGAGQMSLGDLARLPIDTFKIDRSFIAGIDRDPHAMAVTEAAIAIAKTLGVKVAVGGIESTHASAVAIEHACDLLQGYSIAEPMPADRFPPWLKAYEAASPRKLH